VLGVQLTVNCLKQFKQIQNIINTKTNNVSVTIKTNSVTLSVTIKKYHLQSYIFKHTTLPPPSPMHSDDWKRKLTRQMYPLRIVLWSSWTFELIKFCQNFGETFGESFGKFWKVSSPTPPHPSPPPKKTREKLYILHCAKLTFCRNCDNTIGYCKFRGLKLF